MKREYQSIEYSATTSGFDFDNTYDYCLYRQDWTGREIVCFNADEIDEVLEMIELGEVVIHFNYSILYCKDEKSYNNLATDKFSCFATIF